MQEGPSTAAISQTAQGASTSVAGTAKGKEPMETEQEIVTEKPVTSTEQTQVQAPHGKQRQPKYQFCRLLPMRKGAGSETDKIPHLLVSLCSSLNQRDKG